MVKVSSLHSWRTTLGQLYAIACWVHLGLPSIRRGRILHEHSMTWPRNSYNRSTNKMPFSYSLHYSLARNLSK